MEITLRGNKMFFLLSPLRNSGGYASFIPNLKYTVKMAVVKLHIKMALIFWNLHFLGGTAITISRERITIDRFTKSQKGNHEVADF